MKRLSILVLLFSIVWGGATVLLADDMICAGCGKAISEGSWITTQGKYYHPEHFVCSRCNQQIGSKVYFIEDGKLYDSTCYVNHVTRRCDYCGKGALGQLVTLENKLYHRTCYLEHVAPKCVVCNKPVEGRYFYDDFGSVVCEAHKNAADRCHTCFRMIADEPDARAKRLEDGRHICETCALTAIVDSDEAEDLLEDVRKEMAEVGIMIEDDIDLRLVPVKEFDRYSHRGSQDRLGMTIYQETSRLGGVWKLRDYDVFILYGLPLDYFRAVAAHELMHVWLYRNAPDDFDHQLTEGSCEYAAYLVLADDGTEEAKRIIETRIQHDDEIYGEGFRKVAGWVDQVGVSAWLDYLKHNNNPPW